MRWILASCFLALAASQLLGNSAVVPVPRDGASWEAAHARNVTRAKQGDIDLLFLGDSITEHWTDAKFGLDVWEREFGHLKVANFGIDGDRTQHVLWRLQNGEGEGFSPKAIVLLIGTNNTGLEHDRITPRNSPEEAEAGIAAVVQELRKRFPEGRILLLALLPRGQKSDPQRQQVEAINHAIVHLEDGEKIIFIDFGAEFLAENQQLRMELMPDRLHPGALGYELLANGLKTPLAMVLGQ